MRDLFPEIHEVYDLEVANKLLKANLEGFLRFFDNSPVCMSITNTQRVYIKVNKKFLEKFGYTSQEVIGKTSVQIGILTQEESNKVGTIFREKGKLQNDLVKCIAKDGTEVYTVSSIEIVEINKENYMLSSFLDISKIIQQQKTIEQQNKEIIDSMNYARLIQNAILPGPKQVEEIFPESFILSKPRNIVSGDFYWIKKTGNKIYFSVCDCTGHGAPAALISIIGSKLLNKFIIEYQLSKPAEILNQLNREFNISHDHLDNISEIKDGMDISLCVIDTTSMTFEYAGAYNPVYLIKNNELQKLKTDKIPINLFTNQENDKNFTNNVLKIEKGDLLYFFSDGYADQFGGPHKKKFMYKHFQDLLLSIHQIPMLQQRDKLNQTLEEWKNMAGEEQTDDILVIGIKI